MSTSLDRSRFRVALDFLNMFRMGACINYNHCLVYTLLINMYSLIAIRHIRHSSSERLAGFAPNVASDEYAMLRMSYCIY
jgi:hypothetical protein